LEKALAALDRDDEEEFVATDKHALIIGMEDYTSWGDNPPDILHPNAPRKPVFDRIENARTDMDAAKDLFLHVGIHKNQITEMFNPEYKELEK
jgi:hypothetical protein